MEGEGVTRAAADKIWPHLARPNFAKEKELETKIANVSESWVEDKVPYLWKGKGKTRESADCSGAVWAIYQEAGYKYPYQPTSGFAKLKEFKELAPSDPPRVGDVVHYGGHMALYAGKDSSGKDAVWSTRGDKNHPWQPFVKTELTEFGKPKKIYRYDLP